MLTIDTIKSAVAGNKSSVEVLISEIHNYVAKSVNRIVCGSSIEFDDAMQTAMVGILKDLPTFRGETVEQFLVFAGIIAKNDSLCMITRTKASKRGHGKSRCELNESHVGDTWYGIDAAIKQETIEAINELVGRESDNAREVLRLYSLGYSADAISKITGVSKSGVAGMVKRFVKKGRDLISA
jgi:RNA polymerase sigma factor (sigma-70 family)